MGQEKSHFLITYNIKGGWDDRERIARQLFTEYEIAKWERMGRNLWATLKIYDKNNALKELRRLLPAWEIKTTVWATYVQVGSD